MTRILASLAFVLLMSSLSGSIVRWLRGGKNASARPANSRLEARDSR